jgi:hypothetical protein
MTILGRRDGAHWVRRVSACALLCGACASGSSGAAAPEPSGPPALLPEVVTQHAAQFDDSLADRPAGSQREFAAATYILGHLQRAGYVPLLDPVPVEDLVRSTNVVAAPPRASEPSVVVTAAYDSARGGLPTGERLGVWLELARALYARAPDHAVEFVALGAESSDVGDGTLGSRRLIEFLLGDDLTPLVVSLENVGGSGESFSATGDGADELLGIARRLGVSSGEASPPGRAAAVFSRAGLSYVTVSGSPAGVGRVLLEYLESVPAAL